MVNKSKSFQILLICFDSFLSETIETRKALKHAAPPAHPHLPAATISIILKCYLFQYQNEIF